ncbi:MAG TPA: membrane protein insertion efficiency factor YidD [Ignavibacteriaceae bacterium]|nr:membrane protein insertion efficiency factor YidD [Ignavibacteriaceae bacterium]
MRLALFIVIFLPIILYAQTDWQRWDKAENSYQMKSPYVGRNYSMESTSIGNAAVSIFINAYWIFFSEVDGDNCAFSPTCSSFFVLSVKETNIFQGILMFADRLTRDADFIGRESQYPLAKNGRFYDVPSNYKLDTKEIKYIPPLVLINDE